MLPPSGHTHTHSHTAVPRRTRVLSDVNALGEDEGPACDEEPGQSAAPGPGSLRAAESTFPEVWPLCFGEGLGASRMPSAGARADAHGFAGDFSQTLREEVTWILRRPFRRTRTQAPFILRGRKRALFARGRRRSTRRCPVEGGRLL